MSREERLMPGGKPRYIRVYDAGGGYTKFCTRCLTFRPGTSYSSCECGRKLVDAEANTAADRYTVIFTGRWKGRGGRCHYLSMSAWPFHPQGVGMHGEHDVDIDTNKAGFPTKVGGACRIGRRVTFDQLPDDCRRAVLDDYGQLWGFDAHAACIPPNLGFRACAAIYAGSQFASRRDLLAALLQQQQLLSPEGWMLVRADCPGSPYAGQHAFLPYGSRCAHHAPPESLRVDSLWGRGADGGAVVAVMRASALRGLRLGDVGP